MVANIAWEEMPVCQIRLPEEGLADLSIPPGEYLLEKFCPEDVEIFSKEAALHLATLHPILIWSSRKFCVSGIRTLFIVSNVFPEAQITVGVLPPKLPPSEVRQLILADAWLTGLAFSTQRPQASLFETKARMSKDLLQSLSPGLNLSVTEFAKALKVSKPTLYATRTQRKTEDKKRTKR